MKFFRVFTFLFIICTCAPSSSEACTYAYQNTFFLLGSADDDYYFIQLEMERYVNIPGWQPMQKIVDGAEFQTRWKGELHVISYSKHDAIKSDSLFFELDIADIEYHKSLEPYFRKAFQWVSSKDRFKEALLDEGFQCAYQRDCPVFKLEVDTVEKQLHYRGANHEKHSILFPNKILNRFEKILQLDQSEKDSFKQTNEFLTVWRPVQLRKYRIEEEEIMIATLGWGQLRGYNQSSSEKWKPILEPVEQYIEGNQVLLHGQRIDFFLIKD
jgi:hypothetical protein